MATIRERVQSLLTPEASDRGYERAFNICLASFVALNVLAVMLETVESLNARFGSAFRAFETFSVVIFVIEYLARLWSCTVQARFAHPILGRLRFAVTPKIGRAHV